MAIEDDVIMEYRRCVTKVTGLTPHRPHTKVPADQHTARVFVLWCRTHLVDPLLFVRLRFEHLRSRGPRFTSLASESMVFVAQYREAQDHPPACGVDKQTIRDLTLLVESQEQARARYAREGRPALCEVNRFCGGYDPRSRVCPHCPQARSCAQSMRLTHGFDVPALRAGRLGEMPPHVLKALGGWDGSLSV